MRKIYIFLILALTLFNASAVIAGERDVLEFTPGMEAVEIAPGISVLVPEGTDRHEHKGIITFEDGNEYMVDRFLEIEKRLQILEEEIQELKKAREDKKSEVLNNG